MSTPRFELTFAGAAGTVTGSRHLVRINDRQVLLDCGMFQGQEELRRRNEAPPPFDPAQLDAVVLSHGHLDHCGYLPALVRLGFRGPVHCTPGTADLAAIVLRDAARLQQEDADHANRDHRSRHSAALPLFTMDDAHIAIERFTVHSYGERFPIVSGAQGTFRRAGHILGSASIDLELTVADEYSARW